MGLPLRNVDAELIQKTPSIDTWSLREILCPDTRMQQGIMGADAITNGAAPPDTYCLVWADRAERGVSCNGTSLSDGTLGIYGPGASNHGVFNARSGFTLLSITATNLRARLERLGADDGLFTEGAFATGLIEPMLHHRLREQVHTLFRTLDHDRTTVLPGGSEHLMNVIVDGLLLGLMDRQHTQKVPERPPGGMQERIMGLIVEHLRADREGLLSLQDLCEIGQTGARNLQYTFQRHLGVTPTQFLRLRQLHLARRRLLDASTPSVKNAALHCGFWELGRFSGNYRRLFGESPSATLHCGRCLENCLDKAPPDRRRMSWLRGDIDCP